MAEWIKPTIIKFDQKELMEKIVANASSCGGGCGSGCGCWSVIGWPTC